MSLIKTLGNRECAAVSELWRTTTLSSRGVRGSSWTFWKALMLYFRLRVGTSPSELSPWRGTRKRLWLPPWAWDSNYRVHIDTFAWRFGSQSVTQMYRYNWRRLLIQLDRVSSHFCDSRDYSTGNLSVDWSDGRCINLCSMFFCQEMMVTGHRMWHTLWYAWLVMMFREFPDQFWSVALERWMEPI